MLTVLFIPFLITTMLIELTPGPNMAWLALTSATQGKRSGFAAVAGIATGLAILAVASAVGLAALAARSSFAFSLLRYAGVAYLLWLAWQTWVGEQEVAANRIDATAMAAWFRHGLLLNLLKPKAAVFFLSRSCQPISQRMRQLFRRPCCCPPAMLRLRQRCTSSSLRWRHKRMEG